MTTPYSQTLLAHFRRPHNLGRLDAPHAAHEVLNPLCGDRLSLYVQVAGGRIADVAFVGSGCAISKASAS